MDERSARAVTSAVEVAQGYGLRCGEAECLADGANVLVHLRPSPVVARVATTTALVRKPARLWLERDLEMARYLVAQGFPAVPPSGELPAGPHVHDGFAISFWQFVEHDGSYVASAAETAPLLRELHQVLRGYPGALERLSPFFEIPDWLGEIEAWATMKRDDLKLLRRAHAEIAAQIGELQLPEQALHGDAHRKNLLKTAGGFLWTDFEDACRGPLAWDVACFAGAATEGRELALASYGWDEDPKLLDPFFTARDLQGVVWLTILATRFADRRERAAAALAACRSQYGHGQVP